LKQSSIDDTVKDIPKEEVLIIQQLQNFTLPLPQSEGIQEEKNKKLLGSSEGVNQESFLLEIISKCSPKMLGAISNLKEEDIKEFDKL
jgi:hypothetical protein